MSSLGGLLGTSGGASGSGYAKPALASITDPTNAQQTTDAYNSAQSALNSQQSFANAVQPGGLAALQSQQQLLNTLGQQAAGAGPNPALNQLNQSTGQNVSNQAALMAGQRGSGANAGLIARQAAQQGAATQQQAAGQAATQSAQQQIAYQQQLQAQQAAMVGQQANATGALTSATQNEQNNLNNAQSQFNSASVSNQGNVNSANAGLAANQMTGQQNLIGGIAGGVGSALQFAKGGEVSSPRMLAQGSYVDSAPLSDDQWNSMAANPNQVAPIPSAVAQPALTSNNQGPQSNVGRHLTGTPAPQVKGAAQTGNIIGKGLGTGLNAIFGSPTSSASGPNERNSTDQDAQYLGANVELDDAAKGSGQQWSPNDNQMSSNNGDIDPSGLAARGGKVPALVSPGEQYLPPKAVKEVAKGKKDPLKAGERIPGKPKFPGNNYANDTVPKTLESGGIVIPNAIMQSKNPHFEAMKFVHATIAKNRKGLPKKGDK